MCAFYSECGDDFDEYVRRIVGPMPRGAEERAIKDLWAGRRSKLHLNGKWKKASVLEWRQWKVNPKLHLTEWSVTFELTTVDERSQVAPSAMTHSTITLRVNRMNIKGGGTLYQDDNNDGDGISLVSLEWLDTASPPVNLEEGVLVYKCPYCRCVESVVDAHDQADQTNIDECPVCLEVQECRVLGCGHCVCHTCWSSYRQAAANIGVHLDPFNADELFEQRMKQDEMFSTKLLNGEAKRGNLFAGLVERTLSEEKPDALAHFWKELMVVSVATFFYSDFKPVICKLPISAIKIFLQVLDARKNELFVILNGVHQGGMKEFVSSMSFFCCDVIAEKYRQDGRNRYALPWSQLALFHARQARSRTLLAAAHVFLGSTQQSVGMLREASDTYDSSLGLGSSAGDVWKYREDLLREIEQWTGSSGKLTPGC